MGKRVIKRYSEAFKRQVVREYEESGVTLTSLQMKYGIRGSITVRTWVEKYSTKGVRHKLMVIQSLKERDQVKELKERNKQLEQLVAQLSLDKLMLESALSVIERDYGIDIKKKDRHHRRGLWAPRRKPDESDGGADMRVVWDHAPGAPSKEAS